MQGVAQRIINMLYILHGMFLCVCILRSRLHRLTFMCRVAAVACCSMLLHVVAWCSSHVWMTLVITVSCEQWSSAQ